jgi:hypothetical protein
MTTATATAKVQVGGIVVPEFSRKGGVLGVLRALEARRNAVRGASNFDYINPDYAHAKSGTLKPTDAGKTLSTLKSVVLNGEEVVDSRGFIVATLTNQDWSTKRRTAFRVAKQLSRALGLDIRAMDIVAWNLVCTAILDRKGDLFDLMRWTECVGTPMFTVDGQAQCAYGDVVGRVVLSHLYDGRSCSLCGARVFRVGQQA